MATKSIKVENKTITFQTVEPKYNLVFSSGVKLTTNTLDVKKVLALYLAYVKANPPKREEKKVEVKWTKKK